MRKTMIKKKVVIAICALFTCVLLSSCKDAIPEDKRVDVVSDIAKIVSDNYTNQDEETPLMVNMSDIVELTDDNSDLGKSIEKYDDVKDYKIYLLDNNMVLIITDVIFQSVRGYVISDQEIEGTLSVPDMGFDDDRISIINRVDDSNVFVFRAGL